MRRALCRAPQKFATVNTSTETCCGHPDLSPAVAEPDPCYSKDEIPIPNTSSSFQQVGLAKVHVEILLLSEEWRRSGRDDEEPTDQSADDTDSEESEGDDYGSTAQEFNGSPEAAPTTTTATINNATQVQASPSANQPLSSLKRNLAQRENEDDDDENRRPGKRPRRKPPGVDPTRGRFACPYQAYESSRNCFKPSQRNPRGGCDSISRLRDHLTRKHMQSYRCPRCWKHFNNRDKAQAHPESNCLETEMPSYEWFMSLEQETEVDSCCGAQPVDTWWKLFQLLIPGMAAQDLSQLNRRFCPYYVDMSLSIPSLNLSNIFFEDTPAQLFGQANGSETPSFPLASPSSAISGFGTTSLTSQILNVPIYGTTGPQPPPIPSIEGPGADLMSLSVAPQSSEFDSTVSGDAINTSSTPASSHTMATNSTSDTSQMRRNYERLRTRVSHADAENEELRGTISSTREEVRSAGELLEEVLGMENLEGDVYERLSRAAEILIGVTGRLR